MTWKKKNDLICEYFKGEKNGKKYVFVKLYDLQRNFLGSFFVNGSLVDIWD